MRRGAEEARLGFHLANDAQQHLAPAGIVEPVLRVDQERARSLDREQRLTRETGVLQLTRELLRAVEVGGGEPTAVTLWVHVQSRSEVAPDNGLEVRVVEEVLPETVVGRRKPRDRGGEHESIGGHHASRLA